jgi:hypothetical protein
MHQMIDIKKLKRKIIHDINNHHVNVLKFSFLNILFNQLNIIDFFEYQNRIIKNKIYLTFSYSNKTYLYECSLIFKGQNSLNFSIIESKIKLINQIDLQEWKKQFLMGI